MENEHDGGVGMRAKGKRAKESQLYCSTAITVLSNMVANILGQFNKSLLTSFLLPSKTEGRIKKDL